MKKRLLVGHSLLLFLLCFSLVAWSQEKVVSGRVINATDASPLAGVSVTAKGSSTGTSTDASGGFRLSVPATVNTLVFSFVGFDRREVAITGADIEVSLSPQNSALNEVVVIGYGTRQK